MFPRLMSLNYWMEEANHVTQGEKEMPENREKPGASW